MDATEKINKAVIELWASKFGDAEGVRMPLIYPPLTKNGLLFVGLNPAFGEHEQWSILKGTEYADVNPQEFFDWRNRASFDLRKAQDIETYARKRYAYFEKFRRIAKYVGLNDCWQHVDLFFYRETSQDKLKEVVCDGDELNEFGIRQLELSSQLIRESQPKAILVANAFASRIFVGCLRQTFHMKFAERLGCHTIQLDGKVVPTFLASMLTGQRAMDTFSYSRLRWHIKWTLQTPRQVVNDS